VAGVDAKPDDGLHVLTHYSSMVCARRARQSNLLIDKEDTEVVKFE
jgi:hypothetical protein